MARRRRAAHRCAALLLAVASLAGVASTHAGVDSVAAAPSGDIGSGAGGALDSASRLAPPQRVLLVGDSTLAGVRNVARSQELFVGFDPILDAQGCRRLVWPSCFSDSDFITPNTVEEAILGTPATVDIVVVMSGYNDWNDPFGSFVDTIMAAARSKGAERVVWLTLSTGVRPGSSRAAIEAYAENTQLLWESVPRHPDLVVADWRTYNQRSVGWMGSDGVHLRTRGAFGLADYLSRWIAFLDGRSCTAPLDPGGSVQSPCPNPNTMTRVPDIPGLYGI